MGRRSAMLRATAAVRSADPQPLGKEAFGRSGGPYTSRSWWPGSARSISWSHTLPVPSALSYVVLCRNSGITSTDAAARKAVMASAIGAA